MNVKILDTQFAHAQSAGSKYTELNLPFTWERDFNLNAVADEEFLFVTESCYFQSLSIKHPKKILWLLESPAFIDNSIIQDLKINHNHFLHILSAHPDAMYVNSIVFPVGGCWIFEQDQNVYRKSKKISAIASNKMTTLGQWLRHESIRIISSIDSYGPSYNPLGHKIDALRDYQYHLCFENLKSPMYFSEKLIDCFITGTIPIYFGCENLSQYGFDMRGIIEVNNINEIQDAVKSLDNIKIDQKSIEHNYYKSLEYRYPEERIYNLINAI